MRKAGSVVTSAFPIESKGERLRSASAGESPWYRTPTRTPPAKVERDDDERRDRVAFDELSGAVHRAVEIGFALNDLAFAPRALRIERAGVNVGVDRHLLSGHRVEREASRNFGDALRAAARSRRTGS